MIVPKPKIKRADTGLKPVARPIGIEPRRQQPTENIELTPAEHAEPLFEPPPEATFFDTPAKSRKICYVVDASGSMQGMFSRVRGELKTSVASLRQDHFFNIIFFSGQNIQPFDQNHFVRAGTAGKRRAISFIDSIRPSGRTNAVEALKFAMKITDSRAKKAGEIFFLTDGLDLDYENPQTFISAVINLQNRTAPETAVNTIGFWAEPSDRELLARIAELTGGQFRNIND